MLPPTEKFICKQYFHLSSIFSSLYLTNANKLSKERKFQKVLRFLLFPFNIAMSGQGQRYPIAEGNEWKEIVWNHLFKFRHCRIYIFPRRGNYKGGV